MATVSQNHKSKLERIKSDPERWKTYQEKKKRYSASPKGQVQRLEMLQKRRQYTKNKEPVESAVARGLTNKEIMSLLNISYEEVYYVKGRMIA